MKNICSPKFPSITSSGLWMDDSPLHGGSLPLLMIQIIAIVAVSRGLHFALRPLGQSILVSQILTGIILGPSALGRIDFFRELFSPSKVVNLRVVGIVGLVLFQFVIGVKIDLGMLRKTGKKAFAVGTAGHVVPLALAAAAYWLLEGRVFLATTMYLSYDLFRNTVLMWSMSSIVVVACLLDEMNLLNSKIGRFAMATSLVESFLETMYEQVREGYFLSDISGNTLLAVLSAVSFVTFIALIIVFALPVTRWMVRRTPEVEALAEGYFAFVLLMTFVFGLVSSIIGRDMGRGVFFLGLALPSGPPLGSTLVNRLEGIVSALFFPVLIASLGFKVDFVEIFFFLRSVRYFVFFDVLTFVGKTVGVMVAAFFTGMPFHDILTLTVIMDTKGITELDRLHMWEDIQIMDKSYYTVRMFEIMVVAAVTAPLVKIMYKPSKLYHQSNQRTVMHMKSNVELRLLSCIHTQDQVPATINLLESLLPVGAGHPICIYALHLTELVGRVSSVLIPYEKGKSSCTSPDTNRIVSAFKTFEEKKSNIMSISVQPYITVSPYSSMYDDICTHALDKMAQMILLPFHKTQTSDTFASTGQHIREVNIAVLRHATSSVAILVDHGLIKDIDASLSNTVHKVVVYFFGGADDREGLALAKRMTLNPRIGITVIHFRPKPALFTSEMHHQTPEITTTTDRVSLTPEETSEIDMVEDKLDNDMIHEFMTENINRKNVIYREELVDGEEMVETIRATSNAFDLIVVGRREGEESALTEGLSMWSEYPELGVIGDMLASRDFGCQVSTLVVQQQAGDWRLRKSR